MNALATLILLFTFRLVLPFGAVLLLGEWVRRHEPGRRFVQ